MHVFIRRRDKDTHYIPQAYEVAVNRCVVVGAGFIGQAYIPVAFIPVTFIPIGLIP